MAGIKYFFDNLLLPDLVHRRPNDETVLLSCCLWLLTGVDAAKPLNKINSINRPTTKINQNIFESFEK